MFEYQTSKVVLDFIFNTSLLLYKVIVIVFVGVNEFRVYNSNLYIVAEDNLQT